MSTDDWQRTWLHSPQWFHLPVGEWSRLSPQAYSALVVMGAVGSLALIVDVWARAGAALVAAAHATALAADLLLFRNHEYLAVLLAGLIASTSMGSRFDAGPTVSGFGPLLVRGQILVVYFWAAANKVNGPFLDGWVLEGELAEAFPTSLAGRVIESLGGSAQTLADMWRSPSALPRIASYATVFGEMGLLVCLMVPKWRRVGAVVGIGLHAAIALTMNVFAFGLMMVCTYPLFVSTDRGEPSTES